MRRSERWTQGNLDAKNSKYNQGLFVGGFFNFFFLVSAGWGWREVVERFRRCLELYLNIDVVITVAKFLTENKWTSQCGQLS